MKKRILFVDDEASVLQGIERLLHSFHNEWDVRFAVGGAAALQELLHRPAEVVLSDLRMPAMDGVHFLEEVRTHWPDTVRIALSGRADKELAMDAVGVAHQFLSKPFQSGTLRSTIDRVSQLGFASQRERLNGVIGQMKRLPTLPSIIHQLESLLADPGTSTSDLGHLIAQDVALTTHLLRVVNSSFFGLAHHVSEPGEAATYLGFETLRSLILVWSLHEQCTVAPDCGFSIEDAAAHSQAVAAVARAIADAEDSRRRLVEECYTAGLLHDVGKLVLASSLPDHYKLFTSLGENAGLAGESEIFGTTHAEIGGYLLGLWGLPNEVCDSVRLHHDPGTSMETTFCSVVAVHVANHLVHAMHGSVASAPLDDTWLASIDLWDRAAVWQATAEEILAAQSDAAPLITYAS